jgi:hypothetical protein
MNSRRRTRRTPKKDWRQEFLDGLRETGMVTEACQAVGIGRRTAYDERQRNEEFALAWADVIEESTEDLEREAVRRAKDGSDTLLIFLLKARRPQVYRENVKVAPVAAARPELVHVPDDDDERALEVARILQKADALEIPSRLRPDSD